MQVLVTHMSKFGDSQVCLAGIDTQKGRLVRVKAPDGGFIERHDLTFGGRLLTLGDLVRFDPKSCVCQAPHVENVSYARGSLRVEAHDHNAALSALIPTVASPSLRDGFGGLPVQSAPGRSCKIDSAQRSLCIVRCHSVSGVGTDTWDGETKVKIRWTSDGMQIKTTVDDLRFYPTNHTINEMVVRAMNERCNRPGRVYLACSVAGYFADGYWVLAAGVHFLPA